MERRRRHHDAPGDAGRHRLTVASVETWWARAAEDSAAFRDPASVASLIDGALQSDPETRDAAARALAWVVKALEDDPVDESMALLARRLPELVRGLADRDPFYNGQMISIARRVPIDARTVDALLDLIASTPSSDDRVLPVCALAMCDDGAWTDRVEVALAGYLADPVTFGAAVEAFYCRERRIRRSETAQALSRGVLTARFPNTRRAIGTLCGLLQTDFAALAEAALHDLAAARPELHDEIAEMRRLRARSL